MGNQLELAAHLQVGQHRPENRAGRQLPFNRDHRQEGGPQAALHGVLDRFKGIELHLDLEPTHVQARSG